MQNTRVRVCHKNLRISPSKAIHVCRLIHKKTLSEAYKILNSIDKQKIVRMLFKILLEASANAVNNFAMDGNNLKVEECVANQGAKLKRSFYRAKGRTDLRMHRLTNLSVTLTEEQKGTINVNKRGEKALEGSELSTKKIEEYIQEEEKSGI